MKSGTQSIDLSYDKIQQKGASLTVEDDEDIRPAVFSCVGMINSRTVRFMKSQWICCEERYGRRICGENLNV